MPWWPAILSQLGATPSAVTDLERFLLRWGAPGLILLAVGSFAVALLWLMRGHQKHVARLHQANQDALAAQTAALLRALEGLSSQTDVLRLVKDDLRDLSQGLRDADLARSRDVDRVVETLGPARRRK